MSKPTEQDILVNIQRMYYMATALDIQMEWLVVYLKDDIAKAVKEAKAKNNFVRKRIASTMKPSEIESIELIGEKLVDRFWDEMNLALKEDDKQG